MRFRNPGIDYENVYYPLGLSESEGEELISRGIEYKFIKDNEKKINHFHLILPVEEAVKYKLVWYDKEWWGVRETPYNVRTDDGYVLTILTRREKDFKYYGKKTTRVLASGPLAFGIHDNLHTEMVYFLSAAMMQPMFQTRAAKYSVCLPTIRADHLGDDPRIRAFVDIMVKTGNPMYAAARAYYLRDPAEAMIKAKILMKLKEVRDIMSEKSAEIVEKALRDAGIQKDPKEWLTEELMTTIVELRGNDKAASAKISAIKLMGQYLNMEDTGKRKRTSNEEKPDVPQLTPEEIEAIKKKVNDDGLGTETTTSENAGRSAIHESNLIAFNDESTKSAVS